MTPSRAVVFGRVNHTDEPPAVALRLPAFGLMLTGLTVAVIVLALVSVSIGSVPISLVDVWRRSATTT